jgi:DNA-binding transcriptional LysR family regulator
MDYLDRRTNHLDRLGRRLKLRDLNILLVLGTCGSMATAARRLATSQSVISKTIAELEEEFGVRLFERNARGVEPTDYGHALLRRARAVFDELREGQQDIASLADPSTGNLRIGCTEWLGSGLVAVVIEKLAQRFPRVIFHVDHAHVGTSHYDELRDRKYDLIVCRIPSPFSEEDLTAEVLFNEPIHVVAGATSKWTSRRKIALADLVNEPWLLTPPDTLPRSLVEEAFHAHGLTVPEPTVVTFTYPVRNSLVAMGRYLTVCPGSLLYFNPAGLKLKALPVELPIRPRPVAIVRLKNRTVSPIARLFIDCANEVAAPLKSKYVNGQKA